MLGLTSNPTLTSKTVTIDADVASDDRRPLAKKNLEPQMKAIRTKQRKKETRKGDGHGVKKKSGRGTTMNRRSADERICEKL